MKFVRRKGAYYRACDPANASPMDTTFSKQRGGRWNPPGRFGLLYLNATIRVAAANARKHFENEMHTLFDLRPPYRPVLYEITVRSSDFVDCLTESGLYQVGLSPDYPRNTTWMRTREVGRRAHNSGEHGIASRSAAELDRDLGEELAIFDDRITQLTKVGKRSPFARWYPVLRQSTRKRKGGKRKPGLN